ncbi:MULTISPECIES: carbohydrate kinase [unclassified Pseudactinotalea]|uniref:carbohydrate kinase family protein n=1 Tax=unclassified Pseudactinotalea TaxID=2649176 RepID=UPI00128D122D|nr:MULTISPECIES: carbohydrate kinase [unclassified Pseudactinotalea]MPV48732.1 carbohydrate kinase [Pseudactinotalea sp. HY160]QGH68720.1 carbohydrate kinase [Pseudactinotalea sp. HY158]
MKYALIIGEALVDVVERPGQTPQEHPGGSPANVAYGLARLGREVELATWIGQDPRGAVIRTHLTVAGVRLVHGHNGALRTPTSIARIGADGSAQYEFDIEFQVPEVHLDSDVAVVHTGSIAATTVPGADAIAEIVVAAREYSTITYDPNSRPTLMGTPEQARARIEPLVAAADVVKVSDEDVRWLYPDTVEEDVVRRWAREGRALVVLTRGGAGAFAATSAGIEVEVPAPTVDVVDTVGAGDSFMSALIDALWREDLLGAANRERLHSISGATLEAAMAWCVSAAAITVSRAGANPPTRAELTGNPA